MNILLLFRRQARFASIGSQKKMFQPEQNTPWFRPGVGWGLPAVLTSETSHSWLTRWHLCLECAFGNTNKNASQNSTLCREQKRAAFPKNPRKSGPKSRAQRFKSTDFAKTLFDIFFSDFKNWAQKSPEVVETSGLFALISFLVQLDGGQYRTRTRLPGFGSCFAMFCGHFLCQQCSVLCCLMLCGFWPCFCRKAKNKAKSRAIGTPTFTGSMISPFDGVLQNCRSIRTMNS